MHIQHQPNFILSIEDLVQFGILIVTYYIVCFF